MKIKSYLRWLGNIIQVCLIIFSLIIYYLSDKKMGLMRSLTYKNDVYNKLSLKVWITYWLLFILFLFIITMIREYKKSIKIKSCIMFIVINVLSIIFAVKLNTEIVLSYYILVISVSTLLCVQLMKLNFLEIKK